jgi:hypothetical protein
MTRDHALLRSFPNVIAMSHAVFYRDQAVRDKAVNSLRSCLARLRDEDNPGEVSLA